MPAEKKKPQGVNIKSFFQVKSTVNTKPSPEADEIVGKNRPLSPAEEQLDAVGSADSTFQNTAPGQVDSLLLDSVENKDTIQDPAGPVTETINSATVTATTAPSISSGKSLFSLFLKKPAVSGGSNKTEDQDKDQNPSSEAETKQTSAVKSKRGRKMKRDPSEEVSESPKKKDRRTKTPRPKAEVTEETIDMKNVQSVDPEMDSSGDAVEEIDLSVGERSQRKQAPRQRGRKGRAKKQDKGKDKAEKEESKPSCEGITVDLSQESPLELDPSPDSPIAPILTELKPADNPQELISLANHEVSEEIIDCISVSSVINTHPSALESPEAKPVRNKRSSRRRRTTVDSSDSEGDSHISSPPLSAEEKGVPSEDGTATDKRSEPQEEASLGLRRSSRLRVLRASPVLKSLSDGDSDSDCSRSKSKRKVKKCTKAKTFFLSKKQKQELAEQERLQEEERERVRIQQEIEDRHRRIQQEIFQRKKDNDEFFQFSKSNSAAGTNSVKCLNTFFKEQAAAHAENKAELNSGVIEGDYVWDIFQILFPSIPHVGVSLDSILQAIGEPTCPSTSAVRVRQLVPTITLSEDSSPLPLVSVGASSIDRAAEDWAVLEWSPLIRGSLCGSLYPWAQMVFTLRAFWTRMILARDPSARNRLSLSRTSELAASVAEKSMFGNRKGLPPLPRKGASNKGTEEALQLSQYKPQQSRTTCGLVSTPHEELKQWLLEWGRQRKVKSGTGSSQSVFSRRTSSDDSSDGERSEGSLDSFICDSDSEEEERARKRRKRRPRRKNTIDSGPSAVVVLHGPSGSGKSDAVYQCARQLGFVVLEVNTTQLRSAAAVKKLVSEAVQSHAVLSSNVSTQSGLFSAREPGAGQDQQALILFDEVDNLLGEEESGLCHTIQQVAALSKAPLVLTTETALPTSFLKAVAPKILQCQLSPSLDLVADPEAWALQLMTGDQRAYRNSLSLLRGECELGPRQVEKQVAIDLTAPDDVHADPGTPKPSTDCEVVIVDPPSVRVKTVPLSKRFREAALDLQLDFAHFEHMQLLPNTLPFHSTPTGEDAVDVDSDMDLTQDHCNNKGGGVWRGLWAPRVRDVIPRNALCSGSFSLRVTGSHFLQRIPSKEGSDSEGTSVVVEVLVGTTKCPTVVLSDSELIAWVPPSPQAFTDPAGQTLVSEEGAGWAEGVYDVVVRAGLTVKDKNVSLRSDLHPDSSGWLRLRDRRFSDLRKKRGGPRVLPRRQTPGSIVAQRKPVLKRKKRFGSTKRKLKRKSLQRAHDAAGREGLPEEGLVNLSESDNDFLCSDCHEGDQEKEGSPARPQLLLVTKRRQVLDDDLDDDDLDDACDEQITNTQTIHGFTDQPTSVTATTEIPFDPSAGGPDLRDENTSNPTEEEPFDTQATPTQITDTPRITEQELRAANEMLEGAALEALTRLSQQPSAEPFLEPVLEEDAPNYYELITQPMDLGTISASLERELYYRRFESTLLDKEGVDEGEGESARVFDVAAFVGDVRQVWLNCVEFNSPDSLLARDALLLHHFFEASLGSLVGAVSPAAHEQDPVKSQDSTTGEGVSEAVFPYTNKTAETPNSSEPCLLSAELSEEGVMVLRWGIVDLGVVLPMDPSFQQGFPDPLASTPREELLRELTGEVKEPVACVPTESLQSVLNQELASDRKADLLLQAENKRASLELLAEFPKLYSLNARIDEAAVAKDIESFLSEDPLSSMRVDLRRREDGTGLAEAWADISRRADLFSTCDLLSTFATLGACHWSEEVGPTGFSRVELQQAGFRGSEQSYALQKVGLKALRCSIAKKSTVTTGGLDRKSRVAYLNNMRLFQGCSERAEQTHDHSEGTDSDNVLLSYTEGPSFLPSPVQVSQSSMTDSVTQWNPDNMPETKRKSWLTFEQVGSRFIAQQLERREFEREVRSFWDTDIKDPVVPSSLSSAVYQREARLLRPSRKLMLETLPLWVYCCRKELRGEIERKLSMRRAEEKRERETQERESREVAAEEAEWSDFSLCGGTQDGPRRSSRLSTRNTRTSRASSDDEMAVPISGSEEPFPLMTRALEGVVTPEQLVQLANLRSFRNSIC